MAAPPVLVHEPAVAVAVEATTTIVLVEVTLAEDSALAMALLRALSAELTAPLSDVKWLMTGRVAELRVVTVAVMRSRRSMGLWRCGLTASATVAGSVSVFRGR